MKTLQTNGKIQFESFAIGTPSGNSDLIASVEKLFGKKTIQSPSSFPRMSKQELVVWKAYCPRIEMLEKTLTPIHEIALGIIQETKKQEMFHIYEVWSESEEQIDPILVGVRLREDYSNQEEGMKELLDGKRYENQNNYFMLCRWGESLKPYGEIMKIAYTNTIGRKSIELNRQIRNSQRELEVLEDNTREALGYWESTKT